MSTSSNQNPQTDPRQAQWTASTPLVQMSWRPPRSPADEEADRWREQCEQRRAERQARRDEHQRNEIKENSLRIMIMSAFLFASISLGVMTRLGDNLFSSVVYGILIGVFIDLLGAIALALLKTSSMWDTTVLADEWDEYLDEEYDDDIADFAGLGNAMPISPEARKNIPIDADFVPVTDFDPSHALGGQPQSDLRDFIDALSNDVQTTDDDIIV